MLRFIPSKYTATKYSASSWSNALVGLNWSAFRYECTASAGKRLSRARDAAAEAARFLPEDARLPWGWVENRGLLRALEDRAWREPSFPAQVASMRRLLRLCPDDPLGVRLYLLSMLLDAEQPGEAQALLEQYPEDVSVDWMFGRVLAHAQLNQLQQAEAAFRLAHRRYPKVLAALTPERKSPPRGLDRSAVVVGSAEEAWLYRDEMRHLFVAVTGLLPFLEQVARRMRGGR